MYDVHKTGVLSRENLNAIFGTIESQEPLWEKLKNEHHFLYDWIPVIHIIV